MRKQERESGAEQPRYDGRHRCQRRYLGCSLPRLHDQGHTKRHQIYPRVRRIPNNPVGPFLDNFVVGADGKAEREVTAQGSHRPNPEGTPSNDESIPNKPCSADGAVNTTA